MKFKIGDEVMYGLHGKCVITGVETKVLNESPVSFYQVRSIKNPLTNKAAAKPTDPQILVPVDTADKAGLRLMMTKAEAEDVLKILAEPDYHFSLDIPWTAKQKLLEDTLRKENFIGIAKVVGHLYVLTKKEAIPPAVIIRMFDNSFRVLLRELGEVFEQPTKSLEPIVLRALKQKLAADQ